MFQNSGPFIYSSSALQLSFFDSHSLIVWILYYLKTSSLESFLLFYYLIESYYTKEKWQWRQGYLFWFESYHFDEKMFLYICLLFSFDLNSFFNPETAWEGFNLTSFCGFLKNVFSKGRVRLWFYGDFDIIVSHNFPEKFIKIPQVVYKLWRISLWY